MRQESRADSAEPVVHRPAAGRTRLWTIICAFSVLVLCVVGLIVWSLARHYPSSRYRAMEQLSASIVEGIPTPVRSRIVRSGSPCVSILTNLGASCSEPVLKVDLSEFDLTGVELCSALLSAAGDASGGQIVEASFGPGDSCHIYGIFQGYVVSGGVENDRAVRISIYEYH